MADKHAKVVIIGSGPAGYTAAVYAARAELAPVLISGPQPGGQLTITSDVENYPGFPDGIMGPEMMDRFRAQAERFGTQFVDGFVSEIDMSRRPFLISVDEGRETWTAETVILATGASAKWLGIPGEKELMGKGVSACATCDGFFFKGQEIVVIGGGDTAMEEATFLTKFASRVTVIHRRDSLRASKIMQEKARSNPKISFMWNCGVTEVLGENGVTGVRVKNLHSGEEAVIPCTGFFVAIGHEPNTKIAKGQLDMNEVGYIKVKPGSTRTNIPGIFACGDAADAVYRQAVTAAGTGCMAAIDAERFLEQGE
ncbi:thioredoxin-disulfide reductase [Vulgatibacter incomptus]|uniref:Thioredoxin reductase n=1 Tax=Vulgatibacter incomptus TaxID=1391653 RepID=A0A0K1PF60_9BACT|nr:thioredoxin-disulfide reductase [Vulgatibacter incomptus]AKU92147.1 Thioredoxin reductase [Vulgatibacter incomptus]